MLNSIEADKRRLVENSFLSLSKETPFKSHVKKMSLADIPRFGRFQLLRPIWTTRFASCDFIEPSPKTLSLTPLRSLKPNRKYGDSVSILHLTTSSRSPPRLSSLESAHWGLSLFVAKTSAVGFSCAKGADEFCEGSPVNFPGGLRTRRRSSGVSQPTSSTKTANVDSVN